MAEMGLGYGSEYQLLRFLGHHREELYALIQNAVGQFKEIEWFDYPYENRKSGDGEFKGIECFKTLPNFSEIEKKWQLYWPQRGSAMNWDGVFRIGEIWFFVEAKANVDEAFQPCNAKAKSSKAKIDAAFEKTKQMLNLSSNTIKWRETNCYQLANRLAFINFCKENKIKAKCLYISFLNGYKKDNLSVKTVDEWSAVWKQQYEALGINEDCLEGIVYHIYPDCRQ